MWRMIAAGLFYAIGSLYDIKTRTIPLWLLIIFGVMGIIFGYLDGGSLSCITAGIIIGMIVLILGLVSGWKIGCGDGFVLMVTGFFLGFISTLRVFIYGLFICSLGAGVIFILKRNRKLRIPFVPFLALGFGLEILLLH